METSGKRIAAAASRSGFAVALLVLTAALAAGPARAAFLGLEAGDLIDTIEWDALKTVTGDGLFYTVGTPGTAVGDGRTQSITLDDATVLTDIGAVGTDLHFEIDFVSESNFVPFGSVLVVNITLNGSASVSPDFQIGLNLGLAGENILVNGDFSAPFKIQGIVNLADVASTNILTTFADVSITGGHPDFTAALGTTGVLKLTASLFSFNAPLNILLSDLQMFNSSFNVSMSGTLSPTTPSPFVPEPSTALLFASGLLGLLAMVRRTGVRRF